MELKYRTRGNAIPQGKRKVYFSCHPKDFHIYFDAISKEILDKQNCAVWYDDKLTEPENMSEHFWNLSQMQLFVIPITRAFLCEDNRARDVEFAYAMDNHISVLPIMEERGIEELFNETCREIQFLDPNRREIGYSYEEKLESYLSSVLIGDDLAKEVRAAFAAQIFLSYRKKDKAYAHQLMHLIHKNEHFDDVAIWFDEFLNVGENFNYAIESALKSSSVFTMVVTPNLINEENYVMTTEYPMAIKENKPILPVELMKTDYTELSEKYAGIPRCIEAKNERTLSDKLSEMLQCIVRTERESSPRHNFLIGLAYLSGIEVEINQEKAVKLITSAATAGLPEAMEKLTSMYMIGDGVEIDYKTALQWNKQVVEVKEKAYYENPENGFGDYIRVLISFAQGCHLYLGNLDMAEDAYLKMAEVVSLEHGRYAKEELEYFCYVFLGEIYCEKGDFESAYQYFNMSLSFETLLVNETFTEMTRCQALQLLYFKLGDVCQKMKKYSEAWEYLEKSRSIAQSLVDETGENEDKGMLAGVYECMSRNCEFQNDFSGAHDYLAKGLSVSESIVKGEGASVERWVEYAIGLRKMGELCRKEGNLEEAERCYLFALSVYESAELGTGSIYDRQELGIVYLVMGQLAEDQGNIEKAVEYYNKSLSIHKELWEKSHLKRSRNIMAIIYHRLGSFGDGNLEYLEMACRFFFEEGLDMAYNGTLLPEALSSARKIAIMRNDAKRRIRAIKSRERKAKIASLFQIKKK